MIISVAEYVKDIEVREVVRRSDNGRCRTLDICYSIPGYADLPRKVQNAVYDNVRVLIEKKLRQPLQDVDNNNKGEKKKCVT